MIIFTLFLFYDNTEADKNTIKFMILNYGSTMASVNSIALNCYYKYATKAIVNYQDITAYCDTNYTTDHVVQIVGWNNNTTVTTKKTNIYTPYQTPVKPVFQCVGVKKHISYEAKEK